MNPTKKKAGQSENSPPDLFQYREPLLLFMDWFSHAKEHHADADAMSLGTCDAAGRPHVRIVLLKGADEDGFVFFTNLQSPKSLHCEGNPWVALCFYWSRIGCQVRIRGKVEKVSEKEADDYFATRPRISQIGAWASKQSAELPNQELLHQGVQTYTETFADKPVERPKHWSGWRVRPEEIEFWQAGEHRLHKRLLFERSAAGWQRKMLYP